MVKLQGMARNCSEPRAHLAPERDNAESGASESGTTSGASVLTEASARHWRASARSGAGEAGPASARSGRAQERDEPDARGERGDPNARGEPPDGEAAEQWAYGDGHTGSK